MPISCLLKTWAARGSVPKDAVSSNSNLRGICPFPFTCGRPPLARETSCSTAARTGSCEPQLPPRLPVRACLPQHLRRRHPTPSPSRSPIRCIIIGPSSTTSGTTTHVSPMLSLRPRTGEPAAPPPTRLRLVSARGGGGGGPWGSFAKRLMRATLWSSTRRRWRAASCRSSSLRGRRSAASSCLSALGRDCVFGEPRPPSCYTWPSLPSLWRP